MVLLLVLTCMFNFFYLDRDTRRNVAAYGDKHLNKMLLEYTQMLCTVHHELSLEKNAKLYRATHVKHPVITWIKESEAHWNLVYETAAELAEEKRRRMDRAKRAGIRCTWKRVHKSEAMLHYVHSVRPIAHFIYGKAWHRDPPLCMPEKYQRPDDVIGSYRAYYAGEKAAFLKWEPYAETPEFIK